MEDDDPPRSFCRGWPQNGWPQSDEPATRGRPDGQTEVRLADSTLRSGEPAAWGSGQRKLGVSQSYGLPPWHITSAGSGCGGICVRSRTTRPRGWMVRRKHRRRRVLRTGLSPFSNPCTVRNIKRQRSGAYISRNPESRRNAPWGFRV
jgi:hypothetical protein